MGLPIVWGCRFWLKVHWVQPCTDTGHKPWFWGTRLKVGAMGDQTGTGESQEPRAWRGSLALRWDLGPRVMGDGLGGWVHRSQPGAEVASSGARLEAGPWRLPWHWCSPGSGVHGEVGSSLHFLCSWREYFSPSWAAWAWEMGERGNMKVSSTYLLQSFFSYICGPLKCYNLLPGILRSFDSISRLGQLFKLMFPWGEECWKLLHWHLVDVTLKISLNVLSCIYIYA